MTPMKRFGKTIGTTVLVHFLEEQTTQNDDFIQLGSIPTNVIDRSELQAEKSKSR